ncbi:hypothetical protein Tco_0586653 [Tanacetum coccineum]
MSRSSSTLVTNESAHYPYMISSSEEEPFKDLESEHDATSHKTAKTLLETDSQDEGYTPDLKLIWEVRVTCPTQSVYHIGESSTPTPTLITDRYLQQAAIDQPARPIGPRLDVPRNYGPGMNYQELERMHKLTTVYKTFMSRNPKEFYGTEGAVGLLSWFESVNSKLSITKCAEGNKVEYTACLLQGQALTWWNAQVQNIESEF